VAALRQFFPAKGASSSELWRLSGCAAVPAVGQSRARASSFDARRCRPS